MINNFYGLDVPCYKCEDRRVGCHIDCDRYIAVRKKMDEIKEKAQRERDIDHYTVGRVIQTALDAKWGRDMSTKVMKCKKYRGGPIEEREVD